MEGNKVSNFFAGFFDKIQGRTTTLARSKLGGAYAVVCKKDKKNETLFLDIALVCKEVKPFV
jgi:hypothetical protein